MKLTSKAGDYALLLLMHLATLKEKDTTNVKQVASDLDISVRFLANIANKLVIARILISHRGIGGGIRLGKPIQEISVLNVIEAVDGPVQTMFCQNTHELCTHEKLCEMKHLWDDIQNCVIDKLAQTTIEDLVSKEEPEESGPSQTNTFNV